MAKIAAEKLLSVSIKERRATPSFEDVPIHAADLEKIIRAGLEAPSGYNLQPWRFIVVQDREQKIAALDDEQPAVRHRGGVGGTGVAVQERNLAEDGAFAEHVEHGVLAFHRGNADLHRSRPDGAQAGPGIALGEYVGAALHRLGDDAGAEAIDVLRSELPEQIMISQDGALVGATVRRAGFAEHWHIVDHRPMAPVFQSFRQNPFAKTTDLRPPLPAGQPAGPLRPS